jgi:catechol 2,3-dioxygenase-like lactoylglutathione lyase family enzyme
MMPATTTPPGDPVPSFTGSMIDHLNIAVADLDRSLAFYTPALAVLDIVEILAFPAGATSVDQPEMHGFGWTHKPFFWLIADGTAGTNMHIAFTAKDRATVDAFYETALGVGGTTHLAPGVRPEYHPDYYGAFVFDPDGINVEAVYHEPV